MQPRGSYTPPLSYLWGSSDPRQGLTVHPQLRRGAKATSLPAKLGSGARCEFSPRQAPRRARGGADPKPGGERGLSRKPALPQRWPKETWLLKCHQPRRLPSAAGGREQPGLGAGREPSAPCPEPGSARLSAARLTCPRSTLPPSAAPLTQPLPHRPRRRGACWEL